MAKYNPADDPANYDGNGNYIGPGGNWTIVNPNGIGPDDKPTYHPPLNLPDPGVGRGGSEWTHATGNEQGDYS